MQKHDWEDGRETLGLNKNKVCFLESSVDAGIRPICVRIHTLPLAPCVSLAGHLILLGQIVSSQKWEDDAKIHGFSEHCNKPRISTKANFFPSFPNPPKK